MAAAGGDKEFKAIQSTSVAGKTGRERERKRESESDKEGGRERERLLVWVLMTHVSSVVRLFFLLLVIVC